MHNSIRLCASLAFIAAMAFPAYAKTCVWGGGSGSWNTPANWQGGEKPANGDTVIIENDTSSAAIVNDIEGLTLSQLFVTGSAAATLSGNAVTLTDANAFSNGVASTDMSMPMTLTAAKPFLRTHNAMTFRGDITANSATELTFYYTQKTGYHVGVHGAVTAPNANVVIKPNDNVNRLYRTFTFYGKVVAASLFKGTSSNSIRDNIYLANPANSIPDITAPYANIHCDAANVMTNAILRFGYCENDGRAMYRIWNYNQKIDRFDGSSSTRDLAAVYGSTGANIMPTITMEATDDSYCPATFYYNVSLVWAPKGNHTLTFGKNRSHTNTGTISINGGKAILAGTATFRNVTALSVADNAEFQMNSTSTSITPFAAATSLTVGSGGKFTIAADATQPFTDGTLNIVAASDSEITIPAGMTVSCASIMVDGDYVGGAAATYTGWDNANPGAARRLSCLRGEGLLYVPAHARTCRWLGGSGSWSDYTKWKNSGIPGAGDEVVISNDTASAAIVNDLDGLSLARISVIGTAAATISGYGVTLTEAEAFSNGVANTVCSMPIAFSSSAPYVRTIGNVTFNGDLTGSAPTTFSVALSSNSGTHTITFNGAVNMPNANIKLVRPGNWNAHDIYFNGTVTAASLLKDMTSGAILRNVYLASPGNSIGIVKAPYAKIHCSAANVMTNAVLQFGYCESDSAKFVLGAYDQTIDRFDGTIDGQGQGYVSGSGTLTMEATGNCPCPATFQSSVSLVWAPKGNYALTFTNTKFADQPTTGTLSFNGGTATLDGARRFANASAVSVGADATFVCSSTAAGAFASATSLTVGAGGKFTISSGAGNPFTDDIMDIVAATNAEIAIPSGMSFRCKSFKVGDNYVTGEGGYYTGTDNPSPGTAKTLPCLRGSGTIYVPYRAPEVTAATWTGGGGANESAQESQNWGGTLPDLTEGSLTATFASGGTRAVLSGGEKFTGFVFSGAEAFEVASSGATPAALYTGGIACSSAGDFAISSSLSLAAVQTWTVGAGASLDVSGALSSPSDYALSVIGDGTLTLRGGNSAFIGSMVFDGCTTHASGSEPFGSSGAIFTTSSTTGGANVHFDGVTVSVPVVCNELNGNRYGSFNFAANVTNVFNGSFAFSGLARPSIRGTTIFAGGLSHTSGYRLITANGYSGTFIVTNVAANVTVGLQSDASTLWRLYEPNNDFGTYGVFLNAGAVSCETGFALNSDTMPFGLNWSTSLRLNGHDQRIGSLYFGSSANTDSHVSSSSGPATLYFKQARVATNSVTRIYGEVSLVKAGASEFAVNRAVEATGALAVVEGPFAFTPAGSWANATNVAVRGTGRLSLASSAAFNRKVRVDIADSGRIALADGVEQRIGSLYINGVRKFGGTWGSSASQAKNKDDAHFSGAGVLSVAGGYIMIVR